MEIDGWRAYYDDGSTYESSESEWRELPSDGILGVVVFHDRFTESNSYQYRTLVYGGDWYYLDEDGIPTCTETAEKWGEWIDSPDVPDDELKQSGMVDDNVWEHFEDLLMEDKKWV